MAKFKVGDKVRCIEGSSNKSLNTGGTYTVKAVVHGFLHLEGLEAHNNGWYDHRFELIGRESASVQKIVREAIHETLGDQPALDMLKDELVDSITYALNSRLNLT